MAKKPLGHICHINKDGEVKEVYKNNGKVYTVEGDKNVTGKVCKTSQVDEYKSFGYLPSSTHEEPGDEWSDYAYSEDDF